MYSACSTEKVSIGLPSIAAPTNMPTISRASGSLLCSASQEASGWVSSASASAKAHGASGSMASDISSSNAVSRVISADVDALTGKSSPTNRRHCPAAST